MRNNGIVKAGVMLSVLLILPCSLFAHGGRTDSRGGHKDNKNISGLGSYHYHCGDNPAHLHTNGCPYKQGSSSTTNTNTNTNTNNNTNSNATTNTSNTNINASSNTRAIATYVEQEKTFIIDGKSVQINTITVNHTTLAELKSLSENLGISMTYDSQLKSIDCLKGDVSFTLQIDSKNFWKNAELYTLEVAPIAYNGRTMIPARVVAEAIRKTVTYNTVNNQIVIG